MENLDCSNILRHQICSKHILIAKVIKVLKLQKKNLSISQKLGFNTGWCWYFICGLPGSRARHSPVELGHASENDRVAGRK
jgi:hypothetical protein